MDILSVLAFGKLDTLDQLRSAISKVKGFVEKKIVEGGAPVFNRADVAELVPPQYRPDWTRCVNRLKQFSVAGGMVAGGMCLAGTKSFKSGLALSGAGAAAYKLLAPAAAYRRSDLAGRLLGSVLSKTEEVDPERPVRAHLEAIPSGRVQLTLRVCGDEDDIKVPVHARISAFQRKWIAEAKLQFPICKVSTAQRAAVSTWLRCKILLEKPDMRAVDLLAHIQRITTAYFVVTAEEILQAQVLQDAEVRDRLRLITLADA